jgi:hypothetical protein
MPGALLRQPCCRAYCLQLVGWSKKSVLTAEISLIKQQNKSSSIEAGKGRWINPPALSQGNVIIASQQKSYFSST